MNGRSCLKVSLLAALFASPVFADTDPGAQQAGAEQADETVSKVTYRDLPVWEVGFGGVVVNTPHYPSSDQRRTLAVPFPFLVYRTDWLRVDGGSVSGVLLESDDLVIDVSLGGSLSVSSDDNDARSGMDDLDYTVELGPSVEYKITDFDAGRGRVDGRVALRAALSTDFGSIDYRGFVFNPSVKAIWRFDPRWSTSLKLSTQWASSDFHDYFYGVETPFATANRPAYAGTSGYGGTSVSGSVWYRGESFSVGTFMGYTNLSGVVFDDSPLFKQQSAATIGLSFIVRLFESDETIRVRDDGAQ